MHFNQVLFNHNTRESFPQLVNVLDLGILSPPDKQLTDDAADHRPVCTVDTLGDSVTLTFDLFTTHAHTSTCLHRY